MTQHAVHQSLSSDGDPSTTNHKHYLSHYKPWYWYYLFWRIKGPNIIENFGSEIPNGKVLLLSPIDSLDKEKLEKNIGYIDKMKNNIENLAIGLKCNL